MIGIEPYVTSSNVNLPANNATPWHFEGFYKYKLADNISITPGFIYITNPNQTSGNSAFIGTLRTTFTF
jgi:carbohydrate-selective porin OprB